MAHHSSGPSPEIDMIFAQHGQLLRQQKSGLGPTKQFPEGKLTQDDEGEIRIAIGQKDGKVVIDFGSPVAWIGFTAEQAEGIATTLQEHARECRLRRHV